MRSLFIGNTDNAVKEVIKYFDSQVDRKLNDIYRKKKLDYEKLFFCKKYDNIFYFAEGFNNHIDDLNNFLQIVDNSDDVKKYVYIVRGTKFNIDLENEKIDIIKEIFEGYSNKKNKKIIFLNASCIYGKNFIDGEINKIKDRKKYIKETGNYIHVEDFSRFLYLLAIHKVSENYIELKSNVYVNIGELISKKQIKEKREDNNCLFNYKFEHSIVNDINNGLNVIDISKKQKEDKKISPVIKILEIMIMFFISEFLMNYFNTKFNLQYIDFRLIFITIVAIYYNFKYSLFASLLVIVSFLLSSISSAHDLSMILSNTDNLVLVVVYIIIAIITQNKIEKYENSIRTANETIEVLKKQNKHKERNLKKYEMRIKELNRELITYDNSFSKVSTLINDYKSVNSMDVYKIFSDNLGIENIVVFDLIKKDAYSNVDINCDGLINKKISSFISNKEIWVNNDLKNDLPMYIVPIFNNKKITYLVTIWEYDVNILNNEYKNNLISLANIVSFLKECEKE